jgi:hypothetical protein
MTPKFAVGQTVQNVYLGAVAEVLSVYTDSTEPRYEVRYIDTDTTLTAIEAVLSADLVNEYRVDGIAASIDALTTLLEAATSARILGVLHNYQLADVRRVVQDAKHAIFERASLPFDYL